MRMLIASDLHGAPESLAFLLDKARELTPDRVLLLGDLLYHGPRNPLPGGYGPGEMPRMFKELLSIAPVTAVRGNCDAEIDVMLMPFVMPSSALIDADGLEIFASHGHRIPEYPPMGNFAPGTVFARGHTHTPRAECIDGFHFWNPGSLTLPKRGTPRSWGWYENRTFSVFDIDGREVCSESI